MSGFRTAGLGLALLLVLAACTPRDLFFSGAATTGTAAMQERGIKGASDDYGLRLAISEAWFQNSVDLFQRCSLMISKGRVVMIGRVPTESMRQTAESLAHGVGATRLANRITVGPDIPLGRRLNDTAISARLDGILTFDRDVSAINYDVETRDGILYVIGEAGSESERRRVHYLASYLPGVIRVESYIDVSETEDE